MNAGEHVDLLIFLVEQLLELAHFGLQHAHTLLERLGVTPGEGATAELVAGLALESNVGALRAARADAVATYFLGATSVAGLSNAGLAVGADFDHFHRQNSRHDCGSCAMRICVAWWPRRDYWLDGPLQPVIRCPGSWRGRSVLQEVVVVVRGTISMLMLDRCHGVAEVQSVYDEDTRIEGV